MKKTGRKRIVLLLLIIALVLYAGYIISSGRETDISTADTGPTDSGQAGEGAAGPPLIQSYSGSGERTDEEGRTEVEGRAARESGEKEIEAEEPEDRLPEDGEERFLQSQTGQGQDDLSGEETGRGALGLTEDQAGKVRGELLEAVKPVPEKRISLLDRVEEHVVKKGETLWEIARDYEIDIDTIIGANDITNMNRIKPGDILRILPVRGIVYKISPGENLWTISRQFKIDLERIVEANLIADPDMVKPGKILILPGAKPEFGYLERLQQKLIKPVNGRISSHYGGRWGRMHEGIDYAVNTGTPIKAASSGKVIYSGWASGYGKTVIIEHRKGLRTLYAHNSRLLVSSGEWVERGEVITRSGNTGNSTGPHLHFEVQINGKPVNPLSYIK